MRFLVQLLLIFVVFLNVFKITNACKGCISLDEYNINKIIPKFKAVLVKFDVAFPYGEKHDTFVTFAGDNWKNEDLVFADVGIKDYGDRDNEKLAQKFKINQKDDLPAIMLFKKDINNPIIFKSQDITIENLRDFVRDNTDLYIGLPGCDEKYDKIAQKFMSSKTGNEFDAKILAEIEKEENEVAKTYAKYMKKIKENGIGFIKQENKRLNKIIKDSKINEEKKKNLGFNLNILKSFKTQFEKDEL